MSDSREKIEAIERALADLRKRLVRARQDKNEILVVKIEAAIDKGVALLQGYELLGPRLE